MSQRTHESLSHDLELNKAGVDIHESGKNLLPAFAEFARLGDLICNRVSSLSIFFENIFKLIHCSMFHLQAALCRANSTIEQPKDIQGDKLPGQVSNEELSFFASGEEEDYLDSPHSLDAQIAMHEVDKSRSFVYMLVTRIQPFYVGGSLRSLDRDALQAVRAVTC